MKSVKIPRWARYATVGAAMSGCGQAGLGEQAVGDEVVEEPAKGPAASQMERGLERLNALRVFEVSELIGAQAEASGSPYVDGPLELQLARLESFADIAEQAVEGISSDAFANDFGNWEQPNLCIRSNESVCLTISLHEENLARVNALEIVHVDDIIRSEEAATASCYSNWYTVTEEECVRALKLEAIANVASEEM
jgi:hypothetical protein